MAVQQHETQPAGEVRLALVPRSEYDRENWPPQRLLAREWPPQIHQAPLTWRLDNWRRYLLKGTLQTWIAKAVSRVFGTVAMTSELRARVHHADGSITDYDVVSRRVVTTAGANFMVDAFQNLVELELMKYHGYGTGTNAEASGDTGLQTELTTQYATDNTRPTGTQTEGASANIYRSVGVLDPDSAVAITEHGLFSATSSTTLWDRSVFSAINVAATGDTLETTYECSIIAGS